MNRLLRKALRLRKVLIGRDFYASCQVSLKKRIFGEENACWTVYDKNISHESVIYSFGVGTDISFDLALIDQYHVIIHAFDPTPKSIQWVKEQNAPEEFIFHPYGLAARNGKLNLFLPEQENYVSGSILSDLLSSHSKVAVDVYNLSSIMNMLGHQHIDILKMDIEGAEYEVIQNIVEDQININQILIEFHHRFENIGINKTKSAIRDLNKAGYKIFDVSPSGEEFSFIKI